VKRSNPSLRQRPQRVALGHPIDGAGGPDCDPIVRQGPQSSILGQLLEAAKAGTVGRDLRQPDFYPTLPGEPPDLHTQLESMFHAVFKAEAYGQLDDRIDLSLGIRRPKSSS
jgi:hypothetical protein